MRNRNPAEKQWVTGTGSSLHICSENSARTTPLVESRVSDVQTADLISASYLMSEILDVQLPHTVITLATL